MATPGPAAVAAAEPVKVEPTDPAVMTPKAKIEAEVEAKRAAVEKQFKTDTESTKSAGLTKTSVKRTQKKAEAKRKEAHGKIDEIEKRLHAARQKQLDAYKAEAGKYKALAVEREAELYAKASNKIWKRLALKDQIKQIGPHALPNNDADGGKAAIKELFAKYPEPTPYEGAYLFLIALYRLKNCRGGVNMKQTLDMLTKTLHPDCFTEVHDELKVRKHTMRMIKMAGPYVSASYFDPIDAMAVHPLNGYKVDTSAMVVRFEIDKRGSYEKKPGALYKVQVVTGGHEPNHSKIRDLEMGWTEKGWKARGLNGILARVVEPFPQPPESITQEMLDDENNYRSAMDIPLRQLHVLKDGPAGKDYRVPRSSLKGLEKVDLEATRRRLAEEEAKKAEEAAGADAGAEPKK